MTYIHKAVVEVTIHRCSGIQTSSDQRLEQTRYH